MTARLAPLDGHDLWGCLHDAALDSGRPRSDAVARMMTVDGHPRLGWVVPPTWETAAKAARDVLATPGLAGCERLVVIGTGGWGFAVRALCSALRDHGLLPLDSLDPGAARSVLSQAGGPNTAACLAISASRSTVETRLLVDTVTRAWRGDRLAWLSDDDGSLSPRRVPDQVALFGAPISTAFLAPAAFADEAELERAYGAFADRYQSIGAAAASLAASAPADGSPRLVLRLPTQAPDAIRLWVMQVARQGLCGKSPTFLPWLDVECKEAGPADAVADLDLLADCDPLPRLMGMCYAACVFTACLGLRAGIEPARHQHVSEYKRLVTAAPVRGRYPAATHLDDQQQLVHVVGDWLASLDNARRLHIVVYDREQTRAIHPHRDAVSAASGLPCEIHEGTEWNHHSYQAVYGTPDIAVAVVTVSSPEGHHVGRLDRLLAANADMRYAIAFATYQSLFPRSLFIELRLC